MTSTTNLMHQFRAIDTADTEPALFTGGFTTVVPAVLVLIKLIWPNLVSEDMATAIIGLVAVFLPIVTAFLIRRKVWSPASVVKVVGEAVKVPNTKLN